MVSSIVRQIRTRAREQLQVSSPDQVSSRRIAEQRRIRVALSSDLPCENGAMAMCHRTVIRLAVPVLLAVIAGCGGGDDDPTRSTKPAARPTDTTAEASQAASARDE